MSVNFSHDAAVTIIPVMKRCVRVTACSVKFMSIIALAVASMAGTGFAKDGDHDGKRHQLIDRKLVEAMHARHDHQVSSQQGGAASSVSALQTQVADLQSKVATLTSANTSMQTQLQAQLDALQLQVTGLAKSSSSGGSSLSELAKYVKVDLNEINGVKGPHVIFSGAYVHIRSGSGFTDDGGALKGLGNLIVGYNEPRSLDLVPNLIACDRVLTGSHNIVTGFGNVVQSYGGFVAGQQNCIGSAYSSILGGTINEAAGLSSTILGGTKFGTGTDNQVAPKYRPM